ncbi:MAG: PDZ domain-containing protein, partial [Stellaceae bacterium]
GPASEAGLQAGDRILAVGDDSIGSLAGFWRRVWAGGPAGSEIPLRVARDGANMTVRVQSADRTRFLKGPKLH